MKNAKKMAALLLALSVSASSAAVFADDTAENTPADDSVTVTALQDETTAVSDDGSAETNALR